MVHDPEAPESAKKNSCDDSRGAEIREIEQWILHGIRMRGVGKTKEIAHRKNAKRKKTVMALKQKFDGVDRPENEQSGEKKYLLEGDCFRASGPQAKQ